MDLNEDFLPLYADVTKWITTDYKSDTNKWLKQEHAKVIYNFLNTNSKFRKQDKTASLITKFLEASLEQTYVRVGWVESSIRSMVYGDKIK